MEYLLKINELEKLLPKSIDEIVSINKLSTSNSVPYIQHDKETLEYVWEEFIKIVNDEFGNSSEKGFTKDAHRQGIIGRYISDSNKDFGRLWNRLSSTDENYCEWSQPYFTFHTPKEDEKLCLNKYLIKHFRKEKLDKLINDNFFLYDEEVNKSITFIGKSYNKSYIRKEKLKKILE